MTSRFSVSLKGLLGLVTLAAMGLCVYAEKIWGVGASACVIATIGFVAFSLTFATSPARGRRSLFWRASSTFSICYGTIVLGPYLVSSTVDELRITTLPLPSTAIINSLVVSPRSESPSTQRRESESVRTPTNPFPASGSMANGNDESLTFDEKVRDLESSVGLGEKKSPFPPGMLMIATGQVPEWSTRVYLAGQCWFLVLFACAFGKFCVMFQ